MILAAATTTVIGAAIGIGTAIIGVYLWVARHITNSNRHPSRKDIVFKDVCESEKKRIEDCIESEAKLSKERFDTLVKKVDDGFRDIKVLIRNGGRS